MPEDKFVKLRNRMGHFNPLIYAIDRERREIVLWLLEIGADVNEEVNKETPIQRAIFRRNNVILKDLLNHGANMNVMMKNVPLNATLFAMLREQSEAVEIMLEANDYQFPDPGKSSRSVMKQMKEERLSKGDELG